jgi:integrase
MSRKNTINFTKKALDNLPIPTGDSRPSYYDEQINGLLIRVTSKGTKSYMVFRRINGVPKKNTLGTYPNMTIEQARKKAISVLSLISEGINPNKLKKEALSKQTLTLEKVFEDYSISKHNLASSTLKNYISILDNYLNDWKKKAISEITRDMVEQRHRDITQGKGKFNESTSRANTTMRLVRALFNYAKGQYEDSRGEPLFVHNPVDRITHNKGWNKEKIRQGVVHKYDLKKWYEGVMKLPLQEDNVSRNTSAEVVRDFLIFEMFSALRRNEVLEMKWSDIDFKNHSFTIEDTKNNESHSLPLNFKLDEVLERRKNDSGNPYIFQGFKPNGHLHPPKRQLERARELCGGHFTNHDIRRTFETSANRLGLSNYTLNKLVNHKDSTDITGRYIVLDIEELREPMKMIAEELWSQING